MVQFESVRATRNSWHTDPMHYDETSPNARRENFSAYYYKHVALGEGCGCAEQVLSRRPQPGRIIALVGKLIHRLRHTDARNR